MSEFFGAWLHSLRESAEEPLRITAASAAIEKIDLQWQEKLAAKVERAGLARQEAFRKLEDAKRLVEQAIQVAG